MNSKKVLICISFLICISLSVFIFLNVFAKHTGKQIGLDQSEASVNQVKNNKIITSSSASWAYDGMVNWNNKTYLASDEKVSSIEDEIGTILSNSTQEQDENQISFSNKYPVGTKLYKIKNIDPNDAIAIKTNGEYIKAKKIK